MSSHTHDVYASYSRYVTANNVVVRKKASNKGKIVGKDLIRRSNMEDIIDISQQDICQRRNQLLDHTRKQRI